MASEAYFGGLVIQTTANEHPGSPLRRFREFVIGVALPAFCRHYGYDSGGFKEDTIDRVGEHDALWFLSALEARAVVHNEPFFDSARAGARCQIFWQGLKATRPRPITIWHEPVITVGAAGRLCRDFGWPSDLIGLESKGNWAFDLMAYGDAGEARIACEIKKAVRELDEMLAAMERYMVEPPLIEEPAQSTHRNAYRKVKGLREFRPSFFWAVGPGGYEKVFRLEYAEPAHASMRLVQTGLDALSFREGHGCVILKVGAEGGDITLYGQKRALGWQYQCTVSDQTPIFVNEPAIERQSNMAMSWEGALELLDGYPWPSLFPVDVHPEFRVRVIKELELRVVEGRVASHKLEVWRQVCSHYL